MERLVQLYKQFIRFRSTGKPELLFINEELLSRACRRLLLERGGDRLRSILVAVQDAKDRRRRRPAAGPRRIGATTADDETCAEFSGASRHLTAQERNSLLPSFTGTGGLTGLPYLLESTPELEQKARWPTFPHIPDGADRRSAICKELGLAVAGTVEHPGTSVKTQKFMRAVLPSGDSACSVQYRGQHRRDDSWCLINYLEQDELVMTSCAHTWLTCSFLFRSSSQPRTISIAHGGWCGKGPE